MSEIKKNTVTIEEVKANMQDVFVATLKPFDKPVTFVEVRMLNGFTVRESTTCVDPANYDEEIGKQICLKRIEDKIWMLLGYEKQYEVSAKNHVLASTRNMMISPDYKERFLAEFTQDYNRYVGLRNMCDKWDKGKLNFVPTCPRYFYDIQMSSMEHKLAVLVERSYLEQVEIHNILLSDKKCHERIDAVRNMLFARQTKA